MITKGTDAAPSISPAYYAVYYDDAQREHPTPAYVATRFPQNAQHNFAVGRHYVGTMKTVDAAGAGIHHRRRPAGGIRLHCRRWQRGDPVIYEGKVR